MTPYELYCQQETMEKEAFVGAALRMVSNVASMPDLAVMGGAATRWIGGKLGTKAVPGSFRANAAKNIQSAGNWVHGKGTQAASAVNKFMNAGPGISYGSKGNKLTAQRAAVWSGNALMFKDIADSFVAPPKPLELETVKAAAIQKAWEDFSDLVRQMEG